MKRLGSLAASVLLLAACQSSDDVRGARVFADDAVSFAPPDGWEVRRERDTLVLIGSPHGVAAHTTIAVRTAATAGWSEPRTLDNVAASTARVLRALPGAVVRGPVPVEHPVYRGKAFEVTWTPPGRDGRRYQRRHVEIEASDHIYHVLLTAPEGQLGAGEKAFVRVIDTLREEG